MWILALFRERRFPRVLDIPRGFPQLLSGLVPETRALGLDRGNGAVCKITTELNAIEMLKREKQDVLDALDEKSIELSQANDQLSELCHQCCSDDSEDEEGVQIETAMVAKRKRLGE